eukprot:3609638-Rhodomonas_salina.1
MTRRKGRTGKHCMEFGTFVPVDSLGIPTIGSRNEVPQGVLRNTGVLGQKQVGIPTASSGAMWCKVHLLQTKAPNPASPRWVRRFQGDPVRVGKARMETEAGLWEKKMEAVFGLDWKQEAGTKCLCLGAYMPFLYAAFYH